MAILEWHENTTGRYISGVSHGVFFGDDGVPIPWNGLISVTEKFQTNEPTPIYNSLGGKYYLYGNVSEKRHSIVCYTYPEEMEEYLGTEYADHLGFVVDEKPPRDFNMAYRSDCDGYYQLHILFNQIATFGDKTHGTNTATPGISNITMNLQGFPNEAFGTSHVILDSRNPMTASVERVLFGTRNTDGNFDKFLNADIQWVTQAINYAPTIEPDYDNPVMINSVAYPGVKGASKWNTTNVVPYWDEATEQLALHSVSPEEWTQSKLSIPLDVSTPIDLKTSADINFGGMVDEAPIFYSANNPIVTPSYRVAAFVGDQPDENDLVTISFRMDVPGGRTFINIYNSGGSYRIGGVEVTSDGYYTFTVPWKSVDVYNDYISIYPASTPEELSSYPGESTLYWITLEYGGVSTTYSPHPSNDLNRRIIGTSEPQVLSEQAPNVIGPQTVTLKSTVSDNAQVDIYHNGTVGSDDVLVDNLIVTLQNYQGEFFDGNTVPKTRGERYRRVESTSGYYTVYEHLQIKTMSEVGVHTIGSDLYELYGPETQLSTDGDQFTFIGPQATPIGDDEFEIDDTIY